MLGPRYIRTVASKVHAITLFHESTCDSNFVCGGVHTKGGRMSISKISMTTDAITGVKIARGALIFGISNPLCGDGSFTMGPHASHLLIC